MSIDRTSAAPSATGRTLFLSDLHLGALSSRAGLVLRFLHRHPAETYVLVGDILDLWHPLMPHWTEQDQAVIDYLQGRARMGARLIYVRGNHDPDPSMIPTHARLNAEHVSFHVHETPDRKRYLVLHGDEADSRLIRTHMMTRLGSRIDDALRLCDRLLRRLWRRQPDTRSTVEWLLLAINDVRYRGRSHERRLVDEARERGFDGVICGHFHIAALHDRLGSVYANCGDWVDSMTALEDSGDGALRLLGGRAYMFGLVASNSPASDPEAAIGPKAVAR